MIGPPRTALIDIEQMNKALTQLGNLDLSGPITYIALHSIIEGLRAAVINETVKEEKCPSDIPPKSSSPKSETEQ